MKRPGVVWAYSILVAIGILVSAIDAISRITDPVFFSKINSTMSILVGIFTILVLIPEIVFIVKFFMLKKNSITWLYVIAGLSVIINVIAGQYLSAVIFAAITWALWDYISHKVVDGQPVFN